MLNGVYPPSDDTFLLLDAVSRLDVRGKRVLEVGCGCGVISVALAKRGAEVVATDVSPRAAENTRVNARLNGVSVDVVVADLMEGISGSFDLIIFNAPYLECRESPEYSGGTDLVMRFVLGCRGRLRRGGEVYVTACDANDVGLLMCAASEVGLEPAIAARKRLFFEEIYVLRLRGRSSSRACARTSCRR